MHNYTAEANLPFQDICNENRAPAGRACWREGGAPFFFKQPTFSGYCSFSIR